MLTRDEVEQFLSEVPEQRIELHRNLLERLLTTATVDPVLDDGGRSYKILVPRFPKQMFRVIGRRQDMENPNRRGIALDHDLALDLKNVPDEFQPRFRVIWRGWFDRNKLSQPLIQGGLRRIGIDRFLELLQQTASEIAGTTA